MLNCAGIPVQFHAYHIKLKYFIMNNVSAEQGETK